MDGKRAKDAGVDHLEIAIKTYAELIPLYKKVLGEQQRETLLVMNNLTVALGRARRFEEALPILEEVYEIMLRAPGIKDFDRLPTMCNLGGMYVVLNKVDRGSVVETALDLTNKVYGPEHPQTLKTMHQLGASYFAAQRPHDAVAMAEKSWVGARFWDWSIRSHMIVESIWPMRITELDVNRMPLQCCRHYWNPGSSNTGRADERIFSILTRFGQMANTAGQFQETIQFLAPPTGSGWSTPRRTSARPSVPACRRRRR